MAWSTNIFEWYSPFSPSIGMAAGRAGGQMTDEAGLVLPDWCVGRVTCNERTGILGIFCTCNEHRYQVNNQSTSPAVHQSSQYLVHLVHRKYGGHNHGMWMAWFLWYIVWSIVNLRTSLLIDRLCSQPNRYRHLACGWPPDLTGWWSFDLTGMALVFAWPVAGLIGQMTGSDATWRLTLTWPDRRWYIV